MQCPRPSCQTFTKIDPSCSHFVCKGCNDVVTVPLVDRVKLVSDSSLPVDRVYVMSVTGTIHHTLHVGDGSKHINVSSIPCDTPAVFPLCCEYWMAPGMSGHVCVICERFQHRNGNRTTDAWWKQPRALIESGGPFVVDPLNVRIDGMTMRDLIAWDEEYRRELSPRPVRWFTPAQRSALSAHWSAELRSKITTGAARERNQVVLEHDVSDEPWRTP